MPIRHDDLEAKARFKELCVKLGDDLKRARDDDERVRALFVEAVARYMQIARDAGASPDEHPAEVGCAETLRDGGGDTPSPFDLAGATDAEYSKWSDMVADAADY